VLHQYEARRTVCGGVAALFPARKVNEIGKWAGSEAAALSIDELTLPAGDAAYPMAQLYAMDAEDEISAAEGPQIMLEVTGTIRAFVASVGATQLPDAGGWTALRQFVARRASAGGAPSAPPMPPPPPPPLPPPSATVPPAAYAVPLPPGAPPSLPLAAALPLPPPPPSTFAAPPLPPSFAPLLPPPSPPPPPPSDAADAPPTPPALFAPPQSQPSSQLLCPRPTASCACGQPCAAPTADAGSSHACSDLSSSSSRFMHEAEVRYRKGALG
jgi:hypothetical protein